MLYLYKLLTVVAGIRTRRLGWFMKFIVQVATVFHARNEDEDEKLISDAWAWAWWNYNKQNKGTLSHNTQQSKQSITKWRQLNQALCKP